MRRYLYLSTAVAGVVMTAGTGSAWAQCLIIPDCVSLGYKEVSCPDGNGIKCPFGNTFACVGTDVDCSALGYDKTCTGAGEVGSGPTCNGKYASCSCDASYQYICTGTGYASGAGQTCNGKYTSCTCTSPYTWNGSACTCPSTYKYTCSGTGYAGGVGTACGGKYAACTCASGYEWKDGSCQKQVLNGAQGELYYCNGTVVGVRTMGMDFYVAMRDLTALMFWDDANRECQLYTFCGNFKGTLPTKDQLLSIYHNKSKVNSLLSTNRGTKFTEDYYWSSSYGDYGMDYYVVSISNGENNWYNGYYDVYYVRPVLTSW